MAVEGAAELAVFFDSSEFATDATWTSAAGPSTVTGIFNDPHAAVAVLDGLGVSSTEPEFLAPASALPVDAAQGDTLVVAGTSYRVTDLRPSGNGLTRARLEES